MLRRRVCTLLVSLVLFLPIFGVIGQGTASAHALHPAGSIAVCQYNDATCDGQDPYNTLVQTPFNGLQVCSNDAIAWETVRVQAVSWDPGMQHQWGLVTEYGSAWCGTNWARIVLQCDYLCHDGFIANANITRWGDWLRYDGTWYNGMIYSPMVFSPTTPAQACGSMNNLPGGCAPWF